MPANPALDPADPAARLADLIAGFRTAMLVTRRADGAMHARPMWVADHDESGRITFATSEESPKVAEIADDEEAMVTFQARDRYAVVHGSARVIDDRDLVARLWSDDWQVWFPGGKDDPSLRLIVLEGEHGEYWDNSGRQGEKLAEEAERAVDQGTRPRVDDQQHAKTELDSAQR